MRAKPVADRFAAVVVACLVLGHAAGAFAAPLEWPVAEGGNGHFYEYVTTGPLPRDAALVQAAGRTYGGVSGHLATLTSEPAEPWDFAPWGQYFVGVPEPNDASGSGPGEDGAEDYLALFGPRAGSGTRRQSELRDVQR